MILWGTDIYAVVRCCLNSNESLIGTWQINEEWELTAKSYCPPEEQHNFQLQNEILPTYVILKRTSPFWAHCTQFSKKSGFVLDSSFLPCFVLILFQGWWWWRRTLFPKSYRGQGRYIRMQKEKAMHEECIPLQSILHLPSTAYSEADMNYVLSTLKKLWSKAVKKINLSSSRSSNPRHSSSFKLPPSLCFFLLYALHKAVDYLPANFTESRLVLTRLI